MACGTEQVAAHSMSLRLLYPVQFLALALAVTALFVAVNRARAQDPPAATRDFNAAAALQNSGLYGRAGDKWAQFIKDFPTDSRLDRAHYYAGVCQLRAKKYPESAASFRVVLAKFPKFTMRDSAQYHLGLALLQGSGVTKKPEDYRAAAAALAQAANEYPKGSHVPQALYYQGEALYSAGAGKEAIEVYKKLIAEHAASSMAGDAHYAMGSAQQELKLDTDAVATFRAFLASAAFAKHPLVPEMKLRLGHSLLTLKQYPEAEKLLGEVAAIKDFPQADLALLKQAQIKVETNKAAEAAAQYGELLAKFPHSAQRSAAQLAQGKCYFLIGKFDLAQPPLVEVTRATAPESAEAAYWLGRSLLKVGKPESALKVLDWGLPKFTGEFVPYLQLTRIDALYDIPAHQKETPALYEAFTKQHAEHALAPQSIYMASLSALGQRQYAPARTHAEAFLANPKLASHELVPAVMYLAAESQLQAATAGDAAADLNRAKQLYEQLAAKYPQHERGVSALLRFGWCQYQAKQYDPALAYLEATAPKLKEPAQIAEAKFLAGRCHSAAGRPKEAVAAFDASLAAKPDWSRAPEVLLAAAQSCRALPDPAAATERLKRLVSSFPNSSYRPQAIYQWGEIAQEQKSYDEAIARYQELQKDFASSEFVPAARYGLGVVHFAKNEFPQAVAALTALLGQPASAELAAKARYLRGLSHHRLKQFEPASADLQAYLTAMPGGAEALDARFTLGLCQAGLGQFDAGAATLAALLKDKPDYPHADKVHYEMGHALLSAKKPAEAAAAFRALAEKTPSSPLAPEGWFQVGRHHESLAEKNTNAPAAAADFAAAGAAYSAGLAKAQAPDLKEKLAYKLGDMLYRQDKFAEAAAQLHAQLKDHPQGALAGAAAFLAGECHYRAGEFGPALPLFEQVIAKKVERFLAQATYRAGACAGRLQNWKASQQHYEALLAQFPKSEHVPEARYGLGWALKQQGQLPAARAALEKVTKETEAEAAAKARFMIGEIAFEEKKYDEAIEHFFTVATGYPFAEWQGYGYFEVGRCFAELKQKDKAIESLKIVVDKYPTHSKAPLAAEIITNLKK